jgi:hypothetical protein
MYYALKLLDEMSHYLRHSVAITIQSDDCVSVHFLYLCMQSLIQNTQIGASKLNFSSP